MNTFWCLRLSLLTLFLLLLLLTTGHECYPTTGDSSETTNLDELSARLLHPTTHRHHHKHHIRHKHRRRSLTSEEADSTKTQRNKQIMLTKPYWPWP